MALIQTTKVYREVQQSFVDPQTTTISLQGGARSGKTYNIMIWLIAMCVNQPRTTVSIVRKTLPALKRSVFRDFEDIMYKMGLYNSRCMNKSEFVYRFPNGSWIEFFSAEDEQKLRGPKRKILYVNEGNELDFMEWEQLQMRTTHFSIIDYNPSFSDEHWLVSLNAEQTTKHYISTYKDNPFLEDKVVAEIESFKTKNPSLWRIYGLGLQAIVEGLIFENWEEIEEIPRWCKKHRFLGIDFGYTNDPTALVEVCINDNCIYLDEKCYDRKMLTEDIIENIKTVEREENHKFKVISESADPRLVDEIYNADIDIHPVIKGAGSVMAGITKMLEYKIKVTRRSVNAKRELKNYTYRQDKDGHWVNEPIDAFNHILDAARYVILSEVLGVDGDALDAEGILDIL